MLTHVNSAVALDYLCRTPVNEYKNYTASVIQIQVPSHSTLAFDTEIHIIATLDEKVSCRQMSCFLTLVRATSVGILTDLCN